MYKERVEIANSNYPLTLKIIQRHLMLLHNLKRNLYEYLLL